MTETAKPKHHRYRRYSKSLQLLYQSKKAKAYTGVVLTIFAISFFTFFTIRPTLITIAGLLKEIEDQNAISEKLDDKILSLNKAQEEYHQVEDKLYLIDEALPENPDFPALLKQVEALAKVNGLEYSTLDYSEIRLKESKENDPPDVASPVKGTGEIGFNLTTSGPYENLTAFINDIYNFRRLTLTNSFNVNRISASGQDNLSLGMSLKSYYFK